MFTHVQKLMQMAITSFTSKITCYTVHKRVQTLVVQDWVDVHGCAGGGKTVAAITECTAQLAQLERDIGFSRRRPPERQARSTGTQQKLTHSLLPKPAARAGNIGSRPQLKQPRRAHISTLEASLHTRYPPNQVSLQR